MSSRPSRRGRAVLSALCAVLAVASILFRVGDDGVRAQSAAVGKGTLVVRVPRGLLPSQDYWVYVNREIVSAPPRAPFATLRGELMEVAGAGSTKHEFWDSTGAAVVSDDGRLTFIRPGLRERVFKSEAPIKLAPGTYVVELLTRATRAPFPFALARAEARVTSGGTVEIEFGVPAGTNEVTLARAERCSTCRVSAHPVEQTLQFIRDAFARTVQELDQHPMVAVLTEAQLALPIEPARRPTIYARLPESFGGGRELDAAQVSLIVESLWRDFHFTSIADNETFKRAAPPVPELAEFLEVSIAAHNRRLEGFRKVVRALEQAKR